MGTRAALRLVDTTKLDRDQWLEVRRGGIGSSDAAAAVGLCPYKSMLELWMEKTGRVSASVPSGMDHPTFWGTLLEPYVAVAYTQKTERKVRKLNAVLQHPTFPFMLANIDREVVGAADVQILECKTAGEFGSRLWRDGVPEYVQIQVQHQLAVTGKSAADVAVLLCGQKLDIHRIERDEDVIGRLTVLEARFWEYVETDTPPPADGSESSAQALRHLYPGNGSTLDFTNDEALNEVFSALAVLRVDLEEKALQAERLKQTIQQAMGDASRAVFDAGEVTYKRSKDGTSLDAKKLATDHPELVAQYSVPRPGSRRFVLRASNN
ncbi:YqaJ viral recombinase family protein [Coralloluteibacterium stylophorae]|uniref:YqaJ viral recombinase family protein n=1 Tax=Coralloluteibacterium stylophorae TaxID=1776034 RepID=A0A8J7VUY2_9GAMM|nr:YqaJ viral recombinase family protein [Coralloluteibacterium stylophorae]MBS7457895.1 YqaJ viral recombinase family protein [Coralloluteibacterium stylophorae]